MTLNDYNKTTLNQSSGYLKVINLGGFFASCTTSYSLNGKFIKINSPTINLLETYSISIPSTASLIFFTVYYQVLPSIWKPLYSKFFSSIPKKCYRLNGTIFNATCSEIPCDGSNISPIPHCCCCTCRC